MTDSFTHIVVMSCSKDYQGTNRVVVIWRLQEGRVQIPQLERATLGSAGSAGSVSTARDTRR